MKIFSMKRLAGLTGEIQSDLFPQINGVNRTMKPSRQHFWEVSGVPVHVLSSFSNYRSQLCSFPQEKPAERGISSSFSKNPASVDFSSGLKTRHPAEVSKGRPTSRLLVTVSARSAKVPVPELPEVLWTCFDSSE